MGSGASVEGEGKDGSGSGSGGSVRSSPVKQHSRRERMHSEIHLQGSDAFSVVANLHTDDGLDLDPKLIRLLTQAIRSIVYFNEDNLPNKAVETMIKAMHRKDYLANTPLVSKGMLESRFYIIESGKVEISSSSSSSSSSSDPDQPSSSFLGAGSSFGELCLFFESPRSFNAFTIENSFIWHLEKSSFLALQKILSVDSHMNYLLRIKKIPELEVLSDERFSLLVGSLGKFSVKSNEAIFSKGVHTQKIIMVENGSATVELLKESSDDWAKYVEGDAESEKELLKAMGVYKDPLHEDAVVISNGVVTIKRGAVVGMGSLRGKAGMECGWVWENPQNQKEVREGLYGSRSIFDMTAGADGFVGAYFSVRKFEQLFGNAALVLQKLVDEQHDELDVHSEERDSALLVSNALEFPEAEKEGSLESIQLVTNASCRLGVIMLARSKHADHQQVILKTLNKSKVLEDHEHRHVLSELHFLSEIDHSCIVKFLGKYQTQNDVVLVLKANLGGDLYHLLHKHPTFSKEGFSFEMIRFWGAQIVLAMQYIRAKGVVYRNLKPENLLLDEAGNIKMCGFGLSKKLPFKDHHHHHHSHHHHNHHHNNGGSSSSTALANEMKYHYKTHTLVGTPEYLAPEQLTRKGYDWTVDQWAFGVLIHEFATGKTPFADVVRERVFANIHKAVEEGVSVSPEDYQRFGEEANHIQLLVSAMLCDPSERLVWRLGDLHGVSECDIFKGIDWEAMERLAVPPPYVPSPSAPGSFAFQTSDASDWESKTMAEPDTKHSFEDFSNADS